MEEQIGTARYAGALIDGLRTVFEREAEAIERAAQAVADTVAVDGIVYVFGTGHSHMIAEEAFYRAGGLAAFRPILEPPLMLHEGATRSTQLERELGAADGVFEASGIAANDTVFVVSNSGVNAMPVQFARRVKALGATLVALTSVAFSKATPAHPQLDQRLYELADVCIDNHLPPGDALVELADGVRCGPGSTVVGAAVINAVSLRAAELLTERGIKPPVFISANMPGAAGHNAALVEKYRPRIPLL